MCLAGGCGSVGDVIHLTCMHMYMYEGVPPQIVKRTVAGKAAYA